MKVKRMFAAAMLVSLTSAAMAQATYTAANGDEYEFKKHAYLQLQGGAQYTLGEASFGDLISPNIQVGLGYQFNPWLSARIAVGAWQSMGGYNGYKLSEGNFGNKTFKYKYVAPAVDVVFNLSNAIWGYNPFRTVNLSAFVGAAANISFDNDEAQTLAAEGYKMEHLWDGTKVRPAGRAGLALDFRLSDVVSLGAEVNANIISDHYNSKHADNADWYFNGLVGLKFNLGKTYTKKVKEAPAVVSQPEPVKQVETPAPEPVKEVAPAPVEDYKCDVFFTISSTKVVEVEEAKVAELAEFLKKHSDKNVEISGYADAGTGTDKINDRLAKERAAIVKDMLINKYGIDASRIKTASYGSSVQPFSENDKNRVSICTTAN